MTGEERQVLESWVRRPKTSQAPTQRSRIVLACAEGWTNGQVVAAVGVPLSTVAKWRKRIAADRLEGLSDEPRSGRLRTVSDRTDHGVAAGLLRVRDRIRIRRHSPGQNGVR
ncbi:helix-turn-helix domain-containing protein [Frankia sp. R43]|uniref:helix-turn-helix domain-containing protein n=1 Tax=Frankia sp. R43 TaxID=269536 RepID=UPI001F33B094|nr:helix-turn-helix domain-containing protein [Frankia sp. R43]